MTLIALALFTLLLIYAAIFRQDSNCHCFGELVELSPLESIIKNLVMMALLVIGQRAKDKGHCNEQWAMGNEQFEININGSQLTAHSSQHCIQNPKFLVLSSSFLVLLVFIVSPPDSIYKMIYSTEKEVSSIDLYESFDDLVKIDFDEDEVVFDSISAFDVNEESHLIAIVSSGCKYCRLGLKKLSLIMKNEGISPDNVDVFIWGSPESIIDFRAETMTEDLDYWHIIPNKAIKITYGRFPIFIWIKEKEIVKIGDFRDIY